MKYLLDHFKPYDIGGVNVEPSSQTTTRGVDFKFNIRPAILEVYGE